jgi:hypothetical protein
LVIAAKLGLVCTLQIRFFVPKVDYEAEIAILVAVCSANHGWIARVKRFEMGGEN